MEHETSPVTTKREQWRAHLAAWRSSGLSQTKFCHQHGLTYSTFLYWRSRLKEAPLDREPISFVPVTVTKSLCVVGLTIELDGGVRLQVTEDIDLQWLRRVVQVLQTPT